MFNDCEIVNFSEYYIVRLRKGGKYKANYIWNKDLNYPYLDLSTKTLTLCSCDALCLYKI